MHRDFRKPLILMTPKSHLRSKEASSNIREFVDGCFKEILDDPNDEVKAEQVRRVVLCTGKVVHELRTERDKREVNDIAIVSIEQLYPMHYEALKDVMAKYGQADEVMWCQEEPQNMGAWNFIEPRLRSHLGRDIAYAGRESAASPAPGSVGAFKRGQATLIDAALS